MAKKYNIRKFGTSTERLDFSKTKHNLPVTDLVDIQTESFEWFKKEAIEEVIKEYYPIESSNGKIVISYNEGSLIIDAPEDEHDAIELAKIKGTTYSAKIRIQLSKQDMNTGEVKTDDVLFGEIPLMTSGGSFIINGSEKIIASQIIKAPGAYFSLNARRQDENLYDQLEMFPTRMGSWLTVYNKSEDISLGEVNEDNKEYAIYINVDRKKPVLLSVFLKAFGLSSDDMLNLFSNNTMLRSTLKRDKTVTENEARAIIHGNLKKGDRITTESSKNLFANIFFNKRRYNLSKTGRYMLNRKLNLVERINGTYLAEDLFNEDGEVIFAKDQLIDLEMANKIQESFKVGILPLTRIPGIKVPNVYGSQVDDDKIEMLNESEQARLNLLKTRMNVPVVKVYPTVENKMDPGFEGVNVIGNDPTAEEHHLLASDIIAAFSYYFNIKDGMGSEDDRDSLVNKRVVTIGEQLQNQFAIAVSKVERTAKERMTSKAIDKVNAKNVTNNKFIDDQFKSFFNTNQLSQFMDQMNPLAEISNKRRVTSLGPGGISRETAKIDVRDVHSTHYGRICPIETPEGQNIGLILNFANYAKIDEYGFIQTPYFKVENKIVNPEPVYLTAIEEIGKVFVQSKIDVNENNEIVEEFMTARKDDEYVTVTPEEVDYIDVSSKQMISIAAAAIPFLENDDANRALMGANMQRQAVPLLRADSPIVGTGVESDIAKYSASNIKAKNAGIVKFVDSKLITVENTEGKTDVYRLTKFKKSNQGSLLSQKPLVSLGQEVAKGDLLAEGTSFDNGELAIGKNVTVAFSTWRGYNFEDAIIISEKLVKDDVYTSIHIEEKTIEFRKQKVGDDEQTREVPNSSKWSLRNLDENGIIKIGSEVEAGDVLVGRVSTKGEDNPSAEEKLIASIFSKKSKQRKDTSLKVAHGHGGTVTGVQELSRDNGDKLQDDVWKIVKVYIAQKRKLKVGDKMAGRHGNKGVISIVLPVEDMPHLENGKPVDIMLNPQGVPSRMNIGQVLELHLGMIGKNNNLKFATPVFDGATFEDITEYFQEGALEIDGLHSKNGKFDLYDPILGDKFDSPVSVGVMYMLKLSHMIDDKMHARSVGPYSLITQQPLGGKSQNGGQRFGEMEAWAIEAYGAANVLQELLTYKSDNMEGRNKLYNALVSGNELPEPGTPESFNVLAYELRGLGLKLSINKAEDTNEEIIEGDE